MILWHLKLGQSAGHKPPPSRGDILIITGNQTGQAGLRRILQNGFAAGALTVQVESSGSHNTIIEPVTYGILYQGGPTFGHSDVSARGIKCPNSKDQR